jgi:hypothetical protein
MTGNHFLRLKWLASHQVSRANSGTQRNGCRYGTQQISLIAQGYGCQSWSGTQPCKIYCPIHSAAWQRAFLTCRLPAFLIAFEGSMQPVPKAGPSELPQSSWSLIQDNLIVSARPESRSAARSVDLQLPKLDGITISLTVLSAPALANRFPDGLNASAVMAKECACRILSRGYSVQNGKSVKSHRFALFKLTAKVRASSRPIE